MKKIFVCGCSRPGTSVVQKTMSSNFNLLTLPETDYFINDKKKHKK